MTHGGDEHSLKISALNLLWFGVDSILKILNERITKLMNDKGVYRRARATQGLLNICKFYIRKGLLETKVHYKSPRKKIKKEQNGYEPWRIQKKMTVKTVYRLSRHLKTLKIFVPRRCYMVPGRCHMVPGICHMVSGMCDTHMVS